MSEIDAELAKILLRAGRQGFVLFIAPLYLVCNPVVCRGLNPAAAVERNGLQKTRTVHRATIEGVCGVCVAALGGVGARASRGGEKNEKKEDPL